MRHADELAERAAVAGALGVADMRRRAAMAAAAAAAGGWALLVCRCPALQLGGGWRGHAMLLRCTSGMRLSSRCTS